MIPPRSRLDFPAMLNGLGLLGVAVEVGTNRGHYAEHFRRHWDGRMLLCVDPWEHGLYAGESRVERAAARKECFDRLSALTREPKRPGAAGGEERGVVMLPFPSLEAAASYRADPKTLASVGDGFDFVYLDGDHSYEGVKADLEAWWPLVKPGGIIAGHDWIPDGWRMYGDGPERTLDFEVSPNVGWSCFVQKAVREFFSLEHWGGCARAINLTHEDVDDGWRSWWVCK